MPNISHLAILGVTPLTLLLGRACCLADRPPVGLYDPDPAEALRGALFLGLSARQRPDQLNPPEAPLRAALVGHQEAAEALLQLPPGGSLRVISLGRFPAHGHDVCYAVPLAPEVGELNSTAISSAIPPLLFRLEGSPEAVEAGRAMLAALSPQIQFES
jgi:hypothetical protein